MSVCHIIMEPCYESLLADTVSDSFHCARCHAVTTVTVTQI